MNSTDLHTESEKKAVLKQSEATSSWNKLNMLYVIQTLAIPTLEKLPQSVEEHAWE